MLYFLLLTLISLLFIIYIIKQGDYMAPSFLLVSGFIFSALFSIYIANELNLKLNFDTYGFILAGIIAFIAGDLIFSGRKSKYIFYKRSKIETTYIFVARYKTVIFIIAGVCSLALFLIYLIQSVGYTGTWMDIMIRYRYATAYKNQMGRIAYIPSWVAFLRFAVISCCYLWIYILINNFIITKKIEWNLVIAIAISLINTLAGASRLDLIRIPIAAITVYYIISYRTGRLRSSVRLKLLIKVVFIAVCILLLFSSIRGMVGRTSELSILDYLSHYIGSPIINFNSFLENPIRNTQIFGKETFWGIYDVLGKLFKKSEYIYDYTLEFNSINSFGLGNVYTAFRLFYADFGIYGIIILPFIQGAIFSLFYSTIKNNIHIKTNIRLFQKSLIDFRVIIYATIVHSLILMFYADWFYSQVLTWNQIKGFLVIWIIKFFLVDLDQRNKISKNGRRQ